MRVLFLALLVACSTSTVPQPAPVPEEPAPAEEALTDGEPAEPASPEPEAEPAPAPAPAPSPAPAQPLADGSACLAASDCASGICEGQGCEASAPGTCAPKQRACTRDRRAFCGCDGQTFFASGSCPRQRYAATGECG